MSGSAGTVSLEHFPQQWNRAKFAFLSRRFLDSIR